MNVDMEDIVQKARQYAVEALADQVRGNMSPFITHPDAVAKIVREEIGLPQDCEAAVYLHEATRLNPDALKDLSSQFPAEILKMVEGLNKISLIRPKDTRLEAENYKRLIVSYSHDPRVSVIKIADRLDIMRNLDLFPKPKRERKSLESLLLYIPIAHQLGLYNIKSEMEDIYFKYADPDKYRSITNKLKAGERERDKLMQEFIRPLAKRLDDDGVHYKLKVRTKTAYSIWKKMMAQKVPFEGVFDVFAIRFIIDCQADPDIEKDLCWKVFSMVTEEYESDTNRLRDWISNPKPNGYESLHITVKNKDGAYLEVQIRTRRMDEIAESGLASHWSYKGIKREATLDMWLKSVREMLEKKTGLDEFYNADDGTVMSSEVFVFTPTGELRKLPCGASVLDFAFDIHSNLGLRCTGGIVNGKAVPIREKLHTGDYVEILKNKNQKPSADWLNYVVSSKARSKIRWFLKEEEFKRAEEGKQLLASKCRKLHFEVSDEDLAALMKKYRLKTLKALFEHIADGRVDILEIKSFVELRHGSHRIDIQTPADEGFSSVTIRADGNDVVIEGAEKVGKMDYQFAHCCNPVPGDDIFGFVTRLGGIKIHKISCPNAARLLDLYPYRIIKAKWGK